MSNRVRRLLLPLVLVAACGDGGSEVDKANGAEDTDGGSVPGQSVSVDITAADGGTVTLGSATLDIPAGSLLEDTTITATSAEADASLPESSTVAGLVYDFGPAGTQFDPAATMSIAMVGTPDEGFEAVLSYLDDTNNSWVDLASTVNGTDVSAPVEHFTRFAVRFRAAPAGLDCPFKPCSGDPVGTWTVTQVCLGDTNPFMPDCPGSVLEGSGVQYSSTIQIEAAGHYTLMNQVSGNLSMNVPAECTLGAEECSQLEFAPTVSCTGDPLVECICEVALDDTGEEVGQWAVDGNVLTLYPQDDDPTEMELCVDADELVTYDPLEGTTTVHTR